ncbi:Cu2+-exporting ATPase [Dyadobacter sp. BE34]|uniref:Cu2+-exporting ATPase n=1 Tax=Dyadobacter fermentans TaxID=94254 RepID=A0ABU1R4Y1_9BACT|nr:MULTISPECIES: copper-translocating P-type ATPase [Dyadobacter]MDR6808469.1 Cu2+-exporting ATPase [Dyadobacter fermentans]MDR7046211.1 Cu2+-exporting ATPase [Dyadobacter sp. BE242]MDR7200524.1 Cu2+-exporting ATPase [Dyadobacter sp. BE34]MDR7218484.1 Cu2+-exporting ATPase [Dyadobacter sp. BE31]MDR7266415.1 Cu2+-exporting ATPase [Dyadobacter sp. BE32]
MEHHHHHSHTDKKPGEAHLMNMPANSHQAVHDGGHADHDGHDKHAGHHTADFLKRFWICLLMTVPILVLSHMIQEWAGFHLRFVGDRYVLLALSSMVYFYGGWPFLSGLVGELKSRRAGMMTLVAVAITTAYVYSVAVVLGLEGMDFFWELATLIDIMLIGHWLEMKSQMAASQALESLVALLPSVVHVEKDGQVSDIALKDLRKDDILFIKPGEKVAADGLIIDGGSYVNESMLTGESVPVQKQKDDKVIGGAINGDGVLKVRVTGAGDESYLNKVINMVKTAQSAKSNTQNLADKVAGWLTLVSITVGVVTFIVWYTGGQSLAFALERMVTVMVTSCPHALGVAIPLVIAISTTLSATHGLLIRNRTAFENARKLTTIIFDKTGTLTKGSHEIQKIIPVDHEFSSDQILQYVAAVQQNSEHHIAHGVIRELKQRGLELWKSTDFTYMQGVGVTGLVNGKKVLAVGPNYFSQENKPVPSIPKEVDQATDTVNFVLVDDKLVGIITLADSIRESAAQAILELKRLNIRSFLLTGDNEKIAEAVSQKLNMDGYLANVLPHQKQDKIREFQRKGEIVAMTGDGVNDAPALAQADVGIAVGSGTDVAAETADIILVNSDPMDVVQMITFGRATYRKMVQNLAWAIGYNVVAIPLAAGLLYPSFMLSPAMGAVLMSASTIVVAINAKLLRVNQIPGGSDRHT